MRRFIVAFSIALACIASPALADRLEYLGHEWLGDSLRIDTARGPLTLSFHSEAVVEAFYDFEDSGQHPSRTLDPQGQAFSAELSVEDQRLVLTTDVLRVKVEKSPLRLSYWRGDELLLSEEGGAFLERTLRGFRFRLVDADEKLLGGGQRVLGMDRRGHRLRLENRPHYGYGTESEQMYFSIPGVLSSRNWMLVFDNAARGHADLGATEPDIVQFEADGGRLAYLVAAGENFEHTLKHYITASGQPPMPPRWALGNYASRFGYRSEAEARDVVQKHIDQGFSLDAIVIDLYWFGPDIQGHMGNLAWDHDAWPDPAGMMADFAELGVNTILVTEPFILTTSRRWTEAVDEQVLALNMAGEPKTFDFYFGNTGLLDFFKPETGDWFWGILKDLMAQGVTGWWGDLGEPEVHPPSTRHVAGMANEVHNAYGHHWAESIYQRHVRDFPERRPFIMMRAGSTGSQRYGMIPWTGDVDRSWEGFKPQVELALQMGLFGFGYIHSDLGGFAGGEKFDAELYTRWMQYGVFQPVYRAHAQDHIPPEPVFHDERTQEIVREFIRLRYRLMAYNYTLAWQHSTTGLPLMRPLFYAQPDTPEVFDETNTYLWGDAFLVAPVTEPGAESWSVNLPEGVWFDYFNGSRHEGGRVLEVPVTLETLPVMVRAGSFVPKLDVVQSTDQYSSEHLELHYWLDQSVPYSEGLMFEDDGLTRTSLDDGEYELLRFQAEYDGQGLALNLEREGSYPGMPDRRELTVVIHHPPEVSDFLVDGVAFAVDTTSTPAVDESTAAWFDGSGRLHLRMHWQDSSVTIELR
jgi:oligosaccharide 4-alpha-D-glucosyltransferase